MTVVVTQTHDVAASGNFPKSELNGKIVGMTTLNEILIAAQSLPATERAQLMAALWENVGPNDWVPPSDEWIAESNRRSILLDGGEMSASSWSDVRQRARRKAGLDG